MKNRAKCKLCNSIIESFHRHDYVTCKCGEIAVDGGKDYWRALANDWINFIRLDDEGNEIIIKVEEKETPEPIVENVIPKPTKKEMMDMLQEMIKSYENMPQNALSTACTNYDLLSALMLLSAILRDGNCD